MSVWEKLFDLCVSVLLVFCVPLFYYTELSRELSLEALYLAGEQFLKRAETAGKLSVPMWSELEENRMVSDCIGVELCIQRTIWLPEGKQSVFFSNEELSEYRKEGKEVRLLRGDVLTLTLRTEGQTLVLKGSVRRSSEQRY